jgi:hypothetical protein
VRHHSIDEEGPRWRRSPKSATVVAFQSESGDGRCAPVAGEGQVIARSRGGGEDALLWPRLVLEGKEEGVGVWHGALKRRRGGGLAACTHHGRPMRRGGNGQQQPGAVEAAPVGEQGTARWGIRFVAGVGRLLWAWPRRNSTLL